MKRAEGKDQHVHLLLGLYALGALPVDELVEVEDHLAGCADCRDESVELGRVSAFLGLLTPDDLAAVAADFPAPLPLPSVPLPPPSVPLPSVPPHSAPPPSARRGSRPAGRPAGRRERVRAGRPARILVAAVAIALALGVGAGVWLKAGPADQKVTFAGSEVDAATGVSMSVSVVARGSGSQVNATVTGLPIGRGYQLYAVDVTGHTVVVARWVPNQNSQPVTGHIAATVAQLAFFAVADQSSGAVLVTVRLSKPDSAPSRSP